MKGTLNGLLGRFGYQIQRVPPAPDASRPDPAERAAINELIDRFVATQPAGSRLSSAREWRQYLSNQRLAFFRDVIRVCRDLGVDLDGRRIADIGSGTGYLLRLIALEAPTATLTGYDTLADVMPLARAVCPSATFETRALAEVEASFDVVLCTEVLEHLVAPEAALRRLAGGLEPAGAVVVTVPDGRRDRTDAGAAREDGTAYWGHIHFWSPESWRLFVQRTLPSPRRTEFGRLATGENFAVIWP